MSASAIIILGRFASNSQAEESLPGGLPIEGALYFNSAAKESRQYNGSGWIVVANPSSLAATQVTYDNGVSGLTATDAQAAIDELDAFNDALIAAGIPFTPVGGIVATDVQAAIAEVNSNITDDQEADEVPFDNAASGLTATDVQAAIDEIDTTLDGLGAAVSDVTGSAPISSSGGTTPNITIDAATTGSDGSMSGADKLKLDGIEVAATADQTSPEIKASYELNADTNAFTDSEKSKLTTVEASAAADQLAIEVPYDNTASTMTATDVQAAVDEVEGRVDALEGGGVVTDVSASAPITSTGGGTPDIGIVAATPSVPGSMSAADKTKLDTIETNAKDDQNASQVVYNPATSTTPLISTDVQAAIDELDAIVDGIGAGTITDVTGVLPIVSSGGGTPAISINAATGVADGSMSAGDKAKIDGIEVGATADQVASEVTYNPVGSTTPLVAVTVETAIDELDANADALSTTVANLDAVDISFNPAGSTTPLISTDVDAALKEIDANINGLSLNDFTGTWVLSASGLIANGAAEAVVNTLTTGERYIILLFACEGATPEPVIAGDIDELTDFRLVNMSLDTSHVQPVTAGASTMSLSTDPNGFVSRGINFHSVGGLPSVQEVFVITANHNGSTDTAELLVNDVGEVRVSHNDSSAGSARNAAWVVLRRTS